MCIIGSNISLILDQIRFKLESIIVPTKELSKIITVEIQ